RGGCGAKVEAVGHAADEDDGVEDGIGGGVKWEMMTMVA
nr:hypothetical protein [Tanacetum cinerariifolium]